VLAVSAGRKLEGAKMCSQSLQDVPGAQGSIRTKTKDKCHAFDSMQQFGKHAKHPRETRDCTLAQREGREIAKYRTRKAGKRQHRSTPLIEPRCTTGICTARHEHYTISPQLSPPRSPSAQRSASTSSRCAPRTPGPSRMPYRRR